MRPSARRARAGTALRAFCGDNLYELFEHAVMLVMATLIMLVVAFATWHLILQVLALLAAGRLDPGNPDVFRDLFGMFFTVLIALEFRRSFLLVTGTEKSVVRVRSIILIGMLATVRRLIVLDIKQFAIGETLATAGAILALGVVYWLVRDQDLRLRAGAQAASAGHAAGLQPPAG